MTRAEFLQRLRQELRGVDREEREEILSEYEEHFDHALSAGRDERQVAKALGDPKLLAREIRVHCSIEQASDRPSMQNVLQAMFLIGSLGFFNLVFMLLPFLGVVVVVLVLYSITAAFAVSPLVFLFIDGIPRSTAEWLNIGTALVLCALSVWLWRQLVVMTQWIYRVVLKYLRYHASLIKRRVGQHE